LQGAGLEQGFLAFEFDDFSARDCGSLGWSVELLSIVVGFRERKARHRQWARAQSMLTEDRDEATRRR